jgi:hypothetical protein
MNYLQERLRARYGRCEVTTTEQKNNTSSVPPTSTLKPPPLNIPATHPDPLPHDATNQTLYQAFEWYTPSDPNSGNSYWKQLASNLPRLKELGIDLIWLPPGCKAGNPEGNGYDIYDLWDLGEFDWKGQRPTKWGSREDLNALCGCAKALGLRLIWDAVLNHRTAADFSEEIEGVEVDENGMLLRYAQDVYMHA